MKPGEIENKPVMPLHPSVPIRALLNFYHVGLHVRRYIQLLVISVVPIRVRGVRTPRHPLTTASQLSSLS
jgi:hypothetical protein